MWAEGPIQKAATFFFTVKSNLAYCLVSSSGSPDESDLCYMVANGALLDVQTHDREKRDLVRQHAIGIRKEISSGSKSGGKSASFRRTTRS